MVSSAKEPTAIDWEKTASCKIIVTITEKYRRMEYLNEEKFIKKRRFSLKNRINLMN